MTLGAEAVLPNPRFRRSHTSLFVQPKICVYAIGKCTADII